MWPHKSVLLPRGVGFKIQQSGLCDEQGESKEGVRNTVCTRAMSTGPGWWEDGLKSWHAYYDAIWRGAATLEGFLVFGGLLGGGL